MRSCHKCQEYRRGAGTKACLKCQKYKDIVLSSGKRKTIRYEVIPHVLLEQIAEDCRDNDLATAIDDLPVELGDIVTLRYYRSRTCAEIAVALGCSEISVRRKLHKALEILEDHAVFLRP